MDKEDVIYIYTYVYTHTHKIEYYSAMKRKDALPFMTTWVGLKA